LKLYLNYVIDNKEKNINLAIKNMDNLARMQGFNDSNDVEEYYKNFEFIIESNDKDYVYWLNFIPSNSKCCFIIKFKAPVS